MYHVSKAAADVAVAVKAEYDVTICWLVEAYRDPPPINLLHCQCLGPDGCIHDGPIPNQSSADHLMPNSVPKVEVSGANHVRSVCRLSDLQFACRR